MKFHLIAASLTVMAAASGCAPTGPDNSSSILIESPLSSEATFRNLNKAIRQCYTGFEFHSNYFPEAKEGEISLRSRGDIFQAVWIAVVVKPAPNGATAEVTYRNFYEPLTKPMTDWATGRGDACSK